MDARSPTAVGRRRYLLASGAVVLLPTPGGLGSLDAALMLTLTAAGVPGAAALSAVFGYRLLTAWLPLFPGPVGARAVGPPLRPVIPADADGIRDSTSLLAAPLGVLAAPGERCPSASAEPLVPPPCAARRTS